MYKAFISYTLEDKKCAQRLERELLMLADSDKLYDLKIFRDNTYSKIGENVEDGLKKSLEQSEWLIVICSPDVNKTDKKMNWVNFECRYFSDVLKRKDKIICLISEQAPAARDISEFYPEAIRELSVNLAADGRGDNEWFANVAKIYCRIMGRNDEIHPYIKILWEADYADKMHDSHDKYQQGQKEQAAEVIEDIPCLYGVKGLEWYLLYALETGTANGGFLGRLNGFGARQILNLDRINQYLCLCDGTQILIADWRTLKLCRKYQAHEGKRFKVIKKEGADCFVTVGEGAVLKFWEYRNGEIGCLSTIQLRVRYKNPQKELFKKFDLNGISGTNVACLDSSGSICAVVTGDQISMVELQTGTVWILEIPDRLVTNVPEMNWNWTSFSEDDHYLFIGNGKKVIGWKMADVRSVVSWLEDTAGQARPEHVPEEIYNAYLETRVPKSAESPLELKDNGLWNRDFISEYSAENQVICVGKDKFLWLEGHDTWRLLDLAQDTETRKKSGHVLAARPDDLTDILEQDGRYRIDIGKGLAAVLPSRMIFTDENREKAYLFTRQGKYLGERIVCDREAVKPLSEEKLALPQTYSSLLFDHVNRVKNPGLFRILGFAFLDKKCVVVICEKEKYFIWNIETDEWKECNSEQQALFRDARE